MTTSFIVNHLWQSSCFALLAGLLAFALRENSPKIRYLVWLSASLKFLTPFAVLVSLGNAAPRPDREPVSVAAPVANTLVQIAEPFSPAAEPLYNAHATRNWGPVAIGVVWTFGFLVSTVVRCRAWVRIRATLRAGTLIELPIPIRALLTPGAEEPGIVGFLRPVLVLPAQLLERLNAQQLSAILTHELCHVRRRDNLFAAVHMLVEAVFWFHPFVWWIGSRMLEDRELACDEEVLRAGCEPRDYFEGILKVCSFYTESPLPCVSGVTGADVKKRLRAILAGSIAHDLSGAKKATLATIALAALAAPIAIGVLTAPMIRAQIAPANTPKFDVVSIKPCQEPAQIPGVVVPYPPRGNSSPGNLRTNCYPLLDHVGWGLIRGAYVDNPFTPIIGGPSWIHSAFYEINATADGNPSVATMRGPMMQVLLEDRFKLKIHQQTIEGPVYFLSVARGGPKLPAFTEGSCTPYPVSGPVPSLPPGQQYCMSMIGLLPNGNTHVEAGGVTLDEFSKMLRPVLDRPVINQTGISGKFNFYVEFSGEGTKFAEAASGTPGAASIFTAIQEKLGLKLESGRGPVDTFVIDHIERPAENR